MRKIVNDSLSPPLFLLCGRKSVNVPADVAQRGEETAGKRGQGGKEALVSEINKAVGSGDSEGTEGDKGEATDKSTATRPNVFFIMVDDMGYNDIGYQSTDLQGVTPHLDKLAADGIKVMVDAGGIRCVCVHV